MKKFLCSLLILSLGSSAVTVLASPLTSKKNNVDLLPTNEIKVISNKNVSEKISPKAQYGVITSNNVHFRKAPGLSSTIYGQLHKGQRVNLVYTNEVYKDGLWWTNILYNGKNGWVASKYVEMLG